jgi:chromosome partitioning protein
MGFLSRKPKPAPIQVDEEHPIVEELQRMEEAVPERSGTDTWEGEEVDDFAYEYEEESDAPGTEGPQAAGPVVEDDSSSSQAAGEEPSSTPPAAEAPEVSAPVAPVEAAVAPPVEAPAPPAQVERVVEAEPEVEEDSGRMMPRDLIAPSRIDVVREARAEAEVPVKHADVIAFANQKGGVAKTTTTLNLAVAFAESGYRVLCVDLDPQGNLTMSQGIDPDKVEKSLYDVLVNDMPISEIIVKREIDIAVASIDLAGAEIAMSTKIGRERSLEKALKEVSADYDFVCMDTPPSLGLLTINALTAANKVIVPVQCEYLSMRGLVQLQNTLRMIQENLNPEVKIEGILPTMFDARTVHAKEAVEILEENFGDLVFKSRIRKAVKFAEAPVKGASVLKYDSGSSAANYYRELAKEVLANGSAE